MGRKVLFKNYQSPGDIVMLSAAIRDLKLSHPDIEIGLDISCKEIFDNNPYIVPFGSMKKEDEGVEFFKADYPLIHNSNEGQYHFIHGFRKDIEDKLGLRIKATKFKGDIHISDEEKSWISQIEELGLKDRFWIINSGIKFDFTAKAWNPSYYQQVVDHFKGKITFVQVGEKKHFHPPLKNTINLVGKTNLRQLIRLVYHSIGTLGPVSLLMHLSKAVESKYELIKNRPCVCLAGGREPFVWEAYEGHKHISTNGTFSCCNQGGCWVSRCSKVFDNDEKDNDDKLCLRPIEVDIDFKGSKLKIPECLYIIKPQDVIRAIEMYYAGDVLKYGSSINKGREITVSNKKMSKIINNKK